MKRVLLLLSFFAICLFGQQTLSPTQKIFASGDVQDMIIKDNILYVATDASKIDLIDLDTKEILSSITIPQIKDFMGDIINSKIYSVDVLGDDIIFVSEGESGYRVLWRYKAEVLEKLIDIDSKYFIKKARYIDSSTVLIGLLTNEHILYNISKKELIYNTQFSTSSFSDFVLSEDKKQYITTDESGIVRLVDTKSADIIKEYPSKNLDRIYQLDYKNGVILTAGQDRKAVVYKAFDIYSMDFNFLLYACALNQNATLGAIAYTMENDVLVFDVISKNRLYSLEEARATITKILFINNKEILVSSDSSQINYYNIGE